MLRKKVWHLDCKKKQPLNSGKNSDAVDILINMKSMLRKTYTSAGHVLKSNAQNQIEDIS